MLTVLWWIGDLLLVAAVLPIAVLLALRIIRYLTIALKALESISRSSQEITSGLPAALTGASAAAQAVETLAHAKASAKTPATVR